MKTRLHRVGWLLLIAYATTGCRPSAPTAGPQSKAVVETTAALRDWSAEPEVDESERAPVALRIVSAAPNVTEMCCALGLRENLVGRTRYCEHPASVHSLPSIGALIDMSDELLLSLKPDIVLVSGLSRAMTDRLQARGIRYESLPDASLDDLFAAIRKLGGLTGRTRTAERLCGRILEQLDDVTARFAGTPAAAVLILTDVLHDPPRPPYVAGPGSFYDAMLKRLGHRNVVDQQSNSFAALSLEYILQANPDVIIELDADGTRRRGGDAEATSLWQRIGPMKAVASNRVFVLSGNQHYVLGPRVAATYAAIASRIAAGPGASR